MTWYGLARRMARSLNVPGSPSAAFTTTVAGRASERLARTVRHLLAGREAGAAAPAQAGGVELVEQCRGGHLGGHLQRPTSLVAVDVGRQVGNRFCGQHAFDERHPTSLPDVPGSEPPIWARKRTCSSLGPWTRTARPPGLGRRQPLLRGARRLHPAPPARRRGPLRAVGRDRRPAVPRGRRQGQPGGGQRHVQPDLEAGLPERVLPRQPEQRRTRSSCSRTASRSAPSTCEPGARTRVLDEQGLAGCFMYPTLGMLYEEILQGRSRGGVPHLPGLQPLAARRLGLRPRGPHPQRAVPHARRRRLGRGGARVGARPRRPPHRDAHRRAHHRHRSPATRSTRCSTRSGRG